MELKAGQTRIAVIEPRCWGLEHVSFNAALVAMVLDAYPDSLVDVYGEAAHVAAVRDLLDCTRPRPVGRVTWQGVTLPPRKASGWARFSGVRRLLAEIDGLFRSTRPRAVIVTTIDPTLLALLKMRMLTSWRRMSAIAVFHELLSALEGRLRSSHRLSLQAALALPHRRGLRYLVLGENILERLRKVAPGMASKTFAVDLPSLLGDIPSTGERRDAAPLTFGFVGGGRGHKGFAEFIALARAILETHPGTRIEIVGSAPPDLAESAPIGLTWSTEKLPMADFVARLRSLSHVIWLGAPKHYNLVASGSLVDAIVLGVPVICQSGPFVNHLFQRFGDIGIRCETPDDIGEAVRRVITAYSTGQQQRYSANLATARTLLAPESTSAQLRGNLAL